MSLHDSVSNKTEEEESDYNEWEQCASCGSTNFYQMLYQSYTETKYADAMTGRADYAELEHVDTYDSDPWACSECNEEPDNTDLIQLLDEAG